MMRSILCNSAHMRGTRAHAAHLPLITYLLSPTPRCAPSLWSSSSSSSPPPATTAAHGGISLTRRLPPSSPHLSVLSLVFCFLCSCAWQSSYGRELEGEREEVVCGPCFWSCMRALEPRLTLRALFFLLHRYLVTLGSCSFALLCARSLH